MSATRGFSLLEMIVSLGLFATLAGSVAAGIVRDNQAQQAILAQTGPIMKLRTALHRITMDLRMAGMWGEDHNHNGTLDEGEDINDNGVLDADWNLAEGVAQGSINFNARSDMRNGKDVIATGVYSARTTYRLRDGDIVREQLRYDLDGNPTLMRAILAANVSGLTFSRTGGVIRVRVSVDIPLGGGRIQNRVLESRVWLRN